VSLIERCAPGRGVGFIQSPILVVSFNGLINLKVQPLQNMHFEPGYICVCVT
jgi:hypothetical protein